MKTPQWKDPRGATVRARTFGYDADDNLRSATDPDGSYAIEYDELARPIVVDEPFGVSLAFGYDAAGNRTTVTDDQGGVVASVYDLANRLTSRRLDGPSGDERYFWEGLLPRSPREQSGASTHLFLHLYWGREATADGAGSCPRMPSIPQRPTQDHPRPIGPL